MKNGWIALGGLGAFLSVAAGAFGAHALSQTLSAERLSFYEVAARYQMYHSLALVLVGVLFKSGERGPWLRLAGYAFVAGILLFSGSLYAFALTGREKLGAITPFGGVAFLAGWALLVWECAFGR